MTRVHSNPSRDGVMQSEPRKAPPYSDRVFVSGTQPSWPCRTAVMVKSGRAFNEDGVVDDGFIDIIRADETLLRADVVYANIEGDLKRDFEDGQGHAQLDAMTIRDALMVAFPGKIITTYGAGAFPREYWSIGEHRHLGRIMASLPMLRTNTMTSVSLYNMYPDDNGPNAVRNNRTYIEQMCRWSASYSFGRPLLVWVTDVLHNSNGDRAYERLPLDGQLYDHWTLIAQTMRELDQPFSFAFFNPSEYRLNQQLLPDFDYDDSGKATSRRGYTDPMADVVSRTNAVYELLCAIAEGE